MIKSKQKKMGILMQYLQMILAILISFIYTPIMLKILGNAEYGIYNLSNSIISYLSLFSLGFGASYIRFYTRYKKNEDTISISKLNGLFLLTFIIIGFIAFICGTLLSNNISIFFNDTYTIHDKSIAHILMIFMTINLALSFPASIFTSYITAQECFVFQKLLNMIRTVIGPFLTLPALLLGWGSIGMIVVSTFVGFIVDIANIYFCIYRLNMKFTFRNLNFCLLKEIAIFSIFIAINQLIDQINWATDKIVLGKICGSSSVAFYAIGAQINTYFTQFSTAISSVFVPQIHRIENSKNDINTINKIHTELFTKVGRIQFMLLMLIMTGFIFFGRYFIYKWAGPQYETSYYVALLLMAPAIIPLTQNIGIEIQRAKNKHQFRSIAYLIMAIINVAISIVFASAWGEVGAALGTTLSLIFGNGIVMNIFYAKIIKIDVLFFWKEILKFIPSLVIPSILGIMIFKFYAFKNILEFGGVIVIYSLVYAISMYFFGMNAYEKDLIKSFANRIRRKR